MHRCIRSNHRAANDVAMPIDVLSRRMDNDVGTEREWPLKRGRQECIVDRDQRARVVGGAGNGFDIGDAH